MNDFPYLQRCLHLARQGGSRVFPNPQVGAVIVYQDQIIGEGFHPYAGGSHAEVAAVASVKDRSLLTTARLYVNLEPCNFYGKTPPCTELILKHQIPEVIVGCKDPNPRVAGKGIARLRAAGVLVRLADDPKAYQDFNRIFFKNQQEKRPYVVLKWAQTADGFIATIKSGQAQATAITSEAANAYVHKLRARHQAIMVGRRTAQIDNPRLNTRKFYGSSPIRIVFDRTLKLSHKLHIFSDGAPTIILNDYKNKEQAALRHFVPDQWKDLDKLMKQLYLDLGICSILVEGGSHLLQQFIDQEVYDEIHCFKAPHALKQGLAAPVLVPHFAFDSSRMLGKDLLLYQDFLQQK